MKYNKNDIISYLQSQKEHYYAKFNIVKIGIFGSYCRDAQTEGSDIDIIFEFGEETIDIFNKKYELRKEITEHFNTPVDLCRIRAIKPIFKDSILSEAIFV